MRNRADLGHDDFPPDEHSDWPRADFKRRSEHQDEWEASQRHNENMKLAAYAQEMADRQRKGMAEYAAAEAAMTPAQKKAREEAHQKAIRELRKKSWPK